MHGTIPKPKKGLSLNVGDRADTIKSGMPGNKLSRFMPTRPLCRMYAKRSGTAINGRSFRNFHWKKFANYDHSPKAINRLGYGRHTDMPPLLSDVDVRYWAKAENICSPRVFRLLTRSGRRKRVAFGTAMICCAFLHRRR
jgi:hypothetical protein